MNASVNPNSKDRLTADQRANEPSMEEILASIRRIISDGDARTAPVAVPQPRIVERRTDPVLPMPRLQEAPKRNDTPLRREQALHQREEVFIAKTMGRSASLEPVKANFTEYFDQSAPALRGTEHVGTVDAGLLSSEANKSIAGAFAALSTVQSVQDKRNMDDIVGNLLKPMLKSWLDDNLPSLVEKLVRAEIERVSRGAKHSD